MKNRSNPGGGCEHFKEACNAAVSPYFKPDDIYSL